MRIDKICQKNVKCEQAASKQWGYHKGGNIWGGALSSGCQLTQCLVNNSTFFYCTHTKRVSTNVPNEWLVKMQAGFDLKAIIRIKVRKTQSYVLKNSIPTKIV